MTVSLPRVFDLVRIDYLLPQEGVLSGPAVKQAPVHPQVPDQRVEGADGGEDDQQVEEHVGVGVSLF